MAAAARRCRRWSSRCRWTRRSSTSPRHPDLDVEAPASSSPDIRAEVGRADRRPDRLGGHGDVQAGGQDRQRAGQARRRVRRAPGSERDLLARCRRPWSPASGRRPRRGCAGSAPRPSATWPPCRRRAGTRARPRARRGAAPAGPRRRRAAGRGRARDQVGERRGHLRHRHHRPGAAAALVDRMADGRQAGCARPGCRAARSRSRCACTTSPPTPGRRPCQPDRQRADPRARPAPAAGRDDTCRRAYGCSVSASPAWPTGSRTTCSTACCRGRRRRRRRPVRSTSTPSTGTAPDASGTRAWRAPQEHGGGWVWGAGRGRVTVRFETAGRRPVPSAPSPSTTPRSTRADTGASRLTERRRCPTSASVPHAESHPQPARPEVRTSAPTTATTVVDDYEWLRDKEDPASSATSRPRTPGPSSRPRT